MLAQSINYHITMISSCIIYPFYLFICLVSKASSGSHTKLTCLPLEMCCLKHSNAWITIRPELAHCLILLQSNLRHYIFSYHKLLWSKPKTTTINFISSQSISNSSSDIIFQGNSTKHCPSWDLLCQDSSKQISNSNAVRLVLFSNRN